MRFPSSWLDDTLLQDPPFLDEFTKRKYWVYTRNQGTAWIARLAQLIQKDDQLREVAIRWAQHAFSEGVLAETPLHVSAPATNPSGHASLASLEVFVTFYWTLFSADKETASKFVHVERKRRGFSYRLPDPDSEEYRDAVAQQSLELVPRVTPAHEEGQGTPSILLAEDPAAAGVDDADVPATGDAASEPQADAPLPCGDEDDKEVVVFSREQDLDAFLYGVSNIEAAHPALSSLVDEDRVVPPTSTSIIRVSTADHEGFSQPLVSFAPTAVPSPSALSTLSSPSISSTFSSTTTAIPEGIETLPASPIQKPSRKRQQRTNVPSGPLRRGAPRHASHPERLALLAEMDAAHEYRIKRGLVYDMADMLPAADDGKEQKRKRKRKKKSQTGSGVDGPGDVSMADNADGNVSVELASAPVATPPHAPNPSTARDGNGVSKRCTRTDNIRRRRKPNVKKKPKKAVAPETETSPPRRSKRPRLENDERSHIHFETTNPLPTTTRTQKGTKLLRAADLPSQSVTTQVSSEARSRKRKRLQEPAGGPEVSSASTPTLVNANRIVANLPRRRQPIRPASVLPPRAPRPSPLSLGLPANLHQFDTILEAAAAEALIKLNDQTECVTEDWVKHSELPPEDDDSDDDFPLASASARRRAQQYYEDSDEEEDIPLCRVVAARGARFAYQILPEHDASLPHPGENRSDISVREGPGMRPGGLDVIPNPVGTRVPRPIPPPSAPKLPLTMEPPIWAQSRQELCETLETFKSYQSGVYFNKGLAKGYLLSAFPTSRDVFARGGRLIISHGGGKAESLHHAKGHKTLQAASDQQAGDKSVRALLTTYQQKKPLVLIIDDRYALFPYDLKTKKDCTYAVLGFYHIAHVWAERQPGSDGLGNVVRYKFAFEWCQHQPAPWWIPPGRAVEHKSEALSAIYNVHMAQPSLGLPLIEDEVMKYTCQHCQRRSPLVYENTWMCLRPDCAAFWTLVDGSAPEDLTYTNAFLNAPFTCNHEKLEDLAPELPATETLDGVVTSRRFSRGWHCKTCGRLSCRYKWQHWECSNCKAVLPVVGKDRSPNEFRSQSASFEQHKVGVNSGIIVSEPRQFLVNDAACTYRIYILPMSRGHIYLIPGSTLVNGAADEIFNDYQKQAASGDLQFRRWPLRSHQCRGELLTNYFSQNTGEPYQYVGGSKNTIPFDAAPSAVVKARALIQSRMNAVFQTEGRGDHFNEVLSAAYMEEQRMAFHSDAENGLGPRVASLSLGSCAFMHFRLNRKYREIESGGTKVIARNVLTLFLRHGDVLIMDGADIQEYYEHTVVPMNFRIAATARYIGKH